MNEAVDGGGSIENLYSMAMEVVKCISFLCLEHLTTVRKLPLLPRSRAPDGSFLSNLPIGLASIHANLPVRQRYRHPASSSMGPSSISNFK
jgi:hypothetical protein